MRKQWRYFSLAIGFFTRIPMPAVPDFQESDLNHSVKYCPLVGLLVGGFAALIYWIAAQLLPIEIAVTLSMVATIYATGCFHEDGLADAADGLGGGWEKAQILTIMQDSRIGTYGAAALIMALLIKFECLTHTPPMLVPVALVTAHALSRYAAVLVIYTQVYVRSSGKSKPLATNLSNGDLLIASLFGLGPLLLLSPALLWALLPAALVWAWFSNTLKRRLGGYTGDCLGAMQQLTEIAFYLGLLGAIGLQLGSAS